MDATFAELEASFLSIDPDYDDGLSEDLYESLDALAAQAFVRYQKQPVAELGHCKNWHDVIRAIARKWPTRIPYPKVVLARGRNAEPPRGVATESPFIRNAAAACAVFADLRKERSAPVADHQAASSVGRPQPAREFDAAPIATSDDAHQFTASAPLNVHGTARPPLTPRQEVILMTLRVRSRHRNKSGLIRVGKLCSAMMDFTAAHERVKDITPGNEKDLCEKHLAPLEEKHGWNLVTRPNGPNNGLGLTPQGEVLADCLLKSLQAPLSTPPQTPAKHV